MPKKVANALTPLFVKSAPVGRHADGGGLYLLVKSSGARSWVFRYSANGKVREAGLGAAAGVAALSLAQARRVTEAKRVTVNNGIDPLAERARQRIAEIERERLAKLARVTFRQAAEAHIALKGDSWRNDKHRAQWTSTLKTYAYSKIGDKAVAEIDATDVLAVIEPIWKTRPETASRLRGRIEVILNSARARGWRTGDNPAAWRGHLSDILPKRDRLTRGHHAAMPFDSVAAFLKRLRERNFVSALALEFTIHTAARSGEVYGARWREFDVTEKLWTVPAERMKAGREHRSPLGARAIEVLKVLGERGCEPDRFVFSETGVRPLSSMAMAMLLRRMGETCTVHGFRSSFRDWAAERTAFARDVAEMALAHSIGDKTEAAYRRGDLLAKRRQLMDAWAGFCDRDEDGSVVPLRRTVA